MEFCDKLNQIFHILSTTNATLSKMSDVHPSLISRFRSGERIPGKDSAQFIKLCKGISLIIEEKQLHEQIKKICNFSDSISVTDAIRQYFYDSEATWVDPYPYNPYKKNKSFSEKLDSIMNMLDLSNIKLAKHLNVDSSLISRYRSGQRTPQKGSEILNNLCTYITHKVVSGGFEDQTANLIGISVDIIKKADCDFLDHLSRWLMDNTDDQSSVAMDNFLETIGTITFKKGFKMQDVNIQELMDTLQDSHSIYTGMEGFRRAIVRFLVTVSMSMRPNTLKLYSDQKMNWLTGDPDFMRKWMTLMATVLLNKNSIQIIHNINRDLNEMLIGIEKWMPLYMTGAVEAFYCTKSEESNFAHTLFIAPGLSSIHANIVSGSEEHGRYHYMDHQDDLEYVEEQYNALLHMTKPLIKVYNDKNTASYNYNMEELAHKPGRTERILLSLNIAAMSDHLLEKILNRNELEPKKMRDLLSSHKQYKKWFIQNLKNGGITDYVPITAFESTQNGNFKLVMPYFITDQLIYYTKQEQDEHIKEICSCLKEYSNYHMVLLRDLPNKNIQISIKGDDSVTVYKIANPSAAFWFGHPSMYRAFSEYYKMLERKAGIPIADKNELINVLEKYI